MDESTIRQDVYLTLRLILATNIVPVDGRVYAAYPKTKITLPLITIEGASVKSVPFLRTKGYLVEVSINIYTKKAADIDSIADLVVSTIEDNQSKLWENQMYLLNFYDSETAGFEDLNGNAGHFRQINFVFRVIK